MENFEFENILAEAIERPGRLMEAYRAFYNYSLGNRILAAIQCLQMGLDISPIATYNQWKEKGRYVKQGSRTLTLCMPITYSHKKTVKNEETGEEEQSCAKYTKLVYKRQWFVLGQTDGEDYAQEPIVIVWRKEKALSELDIKHAEFNSLNGNVQGYATINREIAINPIAQLPLKTIFHEIAHIILGHTD
jgi:hypothetical protein